MFEKNEHGFDFAVFKKRIEHFRTFFYIFFQKSANNFRYDTSNDDNYTQCGVFWRKVLNEGAKSRLIENISLHLVNAAEFIQDKAVDMFYKCDKDYGRRLKEALDKLRAKRTSSMREE